MRPSLAALLALAAVGCGGLAGGCSPMVSKSVGRTDATVEPAATTTAGDQLTPSAGGAPATGTATSTTAGPGQTVEVRFAASEKRRLLSGTTKAGAPAVFRWVPPPADMLNAQLLDDTNATYMVLYQHGAREPEGGTTPEDGCTRWLGIAEKPEGVRIEVHTKSNGAVPFRLGVEMLAGEGATQ